MNAYPKCLHSVPFLKTCNYAGLIPNTAFVCLAGKDEGCPENRDRDDPDAASYYTEGRKKGRQGVVEWVESNGRKIYNHGEEEVIFNHAIWHKKMKEWGIEQ